MTLSILFSEGETEAAREPGEEPIAVPQSVAFFNQRPSQIQGHCLTGTVAINAVYFLKN